MATQTGVDNGSSNGLFMRIWGARTTEAKISKRRIKQRF